MIQINSIFIFLLLSILLASCGGKGGVVGGAPETIPTPPAQQQWTFADNLFIETAANGDGIRWDLLDTAMPAGACPVSWTVQAGQRSIFLLSLVEEQQKLFLQM